MLLESLSKVSISDNLSLINLIISNGQKSFEQISLLSA